MPFDGVVKPKTDSEKHLERSKRLREYIKGIDSRNFNLDDGCKCIGHYGYVLFRREQPDDSFSAVGMFLGVGPNQWLFAGTAACDDRFDHKAIADTRLADHIRSLELKVYAENEARDLIIA